MTSTSATSAPQTEPPHDLSASPDLEETRPLEELGRRSPARSAAGAATRELDVSAPRTDGGAEHSDATTATQPLEPPPIPDAAPTVPTTPVAPAEQRARRWWHALPLNAFAITLAWLVGLSILAGAGKVSWMLIQPQLAKPYTYDEAAFAFAGHAVATTGLPLSNVGHMQQETPGDFSKRFNWALWHPPLYVFLLGSAFSRWGETETTARLVGVASNAFTAVLVYLTATLILARRTRAAPIYAALGTALYAVNPLVIQSALLLDIDGTVLVASIALVTFAYTLLLRSPRSLRSPLTWLLMGLVAGSIALSLWAKMTTSLAVVAAAAVYRLVATRPWRPWRLIVDLLLVAAPGIGLFLGSWWLFSAWKGMPAWYPFRILQIEFADAAQSAHSWRDNPRVLLDLSAQLSLWISPYLVGLFIWAGLARAYDLLLGPFERLGRRLLKRPALPEPWGAWPVDFVLAGGAGIALAYLIKLAASFPKYHISMMPLWAIAVAYLLYRYVPRITWWEPPVYGVVLAGMSGYFVTYVGDQHVIFRGWDFLVPLFVWPATLGFAFLVMCVALQRNNLPRQLTILGVLMTLAWSWGVDLAQSRADYSTAYNYGTAGQKDTAAYLNSILRPNQPFVSSREVAYYTKDSMFIDQDTWDHYLDQLDAQGITTFDGHMIGYDVDVLALFLWDPSIGARTHSFVDAKYDVAFQSLPFIVFVKTS